MGTRTRKLVGMAFLILALSIYILCAVYVAVTFLPEHWFVQLIYYAFAGVIWAFPCRSLLAWMHRLDAQ